MITTLSGSNQFMLSKRLKKIKTDFIKKHGDFALEYYNAGETDYLAVQGASQAMPFLSEGKMVIIDQPSLNKKLTENIKDFINSANDSVDIIFVEPKFDKRSAIYKTLKKESEFIEFNELDESSLVKWIVEEVNTLGGSITSADARFLVNRAGLDQLRLSNEIRKLLSYKEVIDKSAISSLTAQNPQSTVFDLLDSAFSGRTSETLSLYEDQRQQRVEPQAILAMLIWQLHVLSTVKSAKGKSAQEIASLAKLNPFVVRKTQSLANRIDGASLKMYIRKTLKLDIDSKSRAIDVDGATRNLLLMMSGRS